MLVREMIWQNKIKERKQKGEICSIHTTATATTTISAANETTATAATAAPIIAATKSTTATIEQDKRIKVLF